MNVQVPPENLIPGLTYRIRKNSQSMDSAVYSIGTFNKMNGNVAVFTNVNVPHGGGQRLKIPGLGLRSILHYSFYETNETRLLRMEVESANLSEGDTDLAQRVFAASGFKHKKRRKTKTKEIQRKTKTSRKNK
jgi:hypothetical protein